MNSHLSEVSFQRSDTFAEVPRSTSIPAFVVGEAVILLFRTTMLSSIARVSVLSVVVVPFTVRFPPTVTSPVVSTFAKVTDADVPTACPIATVGVAVSPELLVRVTPVPATSEET